MTLSIYISTHIFVTERGELNAKDVLGEDCAKQFLCQLFVSDSSMDLSRNSKKIRVMNLLQEALNVTENSVNQNNMPYTKDNKARNRPLPTSYSIYEWNDLIQMILG